MILAASAGKAAGQLIVELVILAAVLLLTYYTTKWIAGYQKNQLKNSNLEILETIKVAQNKYVEIVRTGKDRYLVLGIGKEEVRVLGELSREELDLTRSSGKGGKNAFPDVIRRFRDRDAGDEQN